MLSRVTTRGLKGTPTVLICSSVGGSANCSTWLSVVGICGTTPTLNTLEQDGLAVVAVSDVEQEGVEPDELSLEVAEERVDEDVGAGVDENTFVAPAKSEDRDEDGAGLKAVPGAHVLA